MSDGALIWRGRELWNFGHLRDALDACATAEEAIEFRNAYRQISRDADKNLRHLTGHLDPQRGAELRGWLRRGFRSSTCSLLGRGCRGYVGRGASHARISDEGQPDMSLSVCRVGRFARGSWWLSVGPRLRPWLRADTCCRRPVECGEPARRGVYRVDRGMAQIGPIFVVLPRRSGT